MLTSAERTILQRKIESLLETLNCDGLEASDILSALVYCGPKNRYEHKYCAWEEVECAYKKLQDALVNAYESPEGMSDHEIAEIKAELDREVA